MPRTQISKNDIGSLLINDDDVSSISLSKIFVPSNTDGHIPQVQGGELVFVPLVSGSVFVDNETPVGIKNGTNLIFTIAYPPAPPSSIQLFKGGILLTQGAGNDYFVDNETITFLVPPEANDIIVVFYRR